MFFSKRFNKLFFEHNKFNLVQNFNFFCKAFNSKIVNSNLVIENPRMNTIPGYASMIKENDNYFIDLIHYFKVDNSVELKTKIFYFKSNHCDEIKYLLKIMTLQFNKFLIKVKKFNKNLSKEGKFPNINEIELYLENKLFKDQEVSFKNLFEIEDKKLKIGDVFYKIHTNLPKVKKIKLPKLILCHFEVIPEIILLNPNNETSKYEWYRKINKNDYKNPNLIKDKTKIKNGWYKISDSFTYIPNVDDVNCNLKFIYTPSHPKILKMESSTIESRNVVEPCPESFPFEERHKYTKNLTGKNEIRCVSYNILAEKYSNSNLARSVIYPQCDPKYLSMSYRKHLLLKEILNYNGDIVCLQEIEESFFKEDLVPFFEKKSSLNGYLTLKKNIKEGLACFYNKKKFNSVENYEVYLCEFLNSTECEDIKKIVEKNSILYEDIKLRNNVLQAVLLENQDIPKNAILVLNTHLYFRPNADNIRLLQACLIVRYIESKLNQIKNKFNYSKVTPIFFGDFNSCPENGIYKLLTTGSVDENQEDWFSCEESIGLNFKHSLNFVSACGVPEYTNYTVNFKGCLDYIFIDNCVFNIDEVVPFIPHEEVDKVKAIPNNVIPSDHLALICKISWI